MARALEQAKRLGALGRVAAMIAHEINNVLMSIETSAQLIARLTRGQPQLDAAAERIMRGLRRGKKITTEILRFARPAQPQFARLNVGLLFATIRSDLQSLLAESIALDIHAPPEDLWVLADREQMEQVVTNLVINARDAMLHGGTITVAVAARGNWLQITVGDTGEGIPAENLDQIFEPLFTTKARGTGLGLAVVQQIVVRHGGTIKAESGVGRGTTFTITMPLARETP
jgi:signal transduction histidine kinase